MIRVHPILQEDDMGSRVRRLGRALAGLFVAALMVSAGTAHATLLAVGAPSRAGSVTVDLIGNYGDSTSARCLVSVDITAGLTAEQKADVLFTAITDACSPGIFVAQLGSTLTLTSTAGTVYINGVRDSTNQTVSVIDPGTGRLVPYRTVLRLKGSPSSGSITFEENGVSNTIPTDGKTPEEVDQAFMDAFIEAIVNQGVIILPTRETDGHSFGFELNDPGYSEIEVEQRAQRSCVDVFANPGGAGQTRDESGVRSVARTPPQARHRPHRIADG